MMMRRMILTIFLLLCLAPSAWPKFKEDEQRYLDDQFKAVLNQMQAMITQVAVLNAELAEVKQSQSEIQVAIIHQQHQLKDLDDSLSSMKTGNAESLSKLKAVIADLRAQTESAVAKMSGQPQAPAAAPAEVAAEHPVAVPATRPAPQGYITAVDGTNVMLDMGSAQGLQQGSHLAIYKATDPNTRVGVLEVTQVIDAGNSRARIVNINAGITPEFSDVVRAQ